MHTIFIHTCIRLTRAYVLCPCDHWTLNSMFSLEIWIDKKNICVLKRVFINGFNSRWGLRGHLDEGLSWLTLWHWSHDWLICQTELSSRGFCESTDSSLKEQLVSSHVSYCWSWKYFLDTLLSAFTVSGILLGNFKMLVFCYCSVQY